MTYLEQLRKAAQQASRPTITTQEAGQDLTIPIREWHTALPAALRKAPRTMDELVKFLPGRSGQGRQARAGDIADALLRLGWQRRRCWQGPRYRRYWDPPA